MYTYGYTVNITTNKKSIWPEELIHRQQRLAVVQKEIM